MKQGDKYYCYSSVGKQIVTIVESGLKVKNPFTGEWTEHMVIVKYADGGTGMAHENQLIRIGIE